MKTSAHLFRTLHRNHVAERAATTRLSDMVRTGAQLGSVVNLGESVRRLRTGTNAHGLSLVGYDYVFEVTKLASKALVGATLSTAGITVGALGWFVEERLGVNLGEGE